MKKILFFLSIFIIVFGIYSIQEYFSYIGPQLAINQAIKNDIERVRLEKEQLDYEHEVNEKQIRREVVTNTFPYALITIFIIVIGTSVIFLYIRYDKRKESWYRQVDGSFALQDMVVNGVKWKVDINKSPSGAIGVAPNGQLLLAPVDESFGPDRQLNYNNKIQNTRTAEAITSSDAGIQNAATGKFLAGAYDRNQKPNLLNVEEKEEKTEPVKLLSLQDAIAQSNKIRWIVGQDVETGILSEINLRDVVNVGIIGSTKTGKTSSTGLLTAYYARKSGYHVVVLDAKGLLDWTPYAQIFEVHKTNSILFIQHIREIANLYTERKKIISEKGVEDFYEELDTHKLKPVVFFLEEFGALCDDLRASNKKDFEIIIKALAKMLRDCRAVGMHFVFIDQETSRWEVVIKSLVKYWIAYKLEASAGNAIGFYYLQNLKDQGEFSSSTNKKTKFKAWHTKKLVDIKTMLKPTNLTLLTDSQDEQSFVNPLQTLKSEYTVVDNPKEDESKQPSEPVKRFLEDLTDDDKVLIKQMNNDGASLRNITTTIFGPGKFGKFYNDIIKEVLDEGN
jgi:hypothetical protein